LRQPCLLYLIDPRTKGDKASRSCSEKRSAARGHRGTNYAAGTTWTAVARSVLSDFALGNRSLRFKTKQAKTAAGYRGCFCPLRGGRLFRRNPEKPGYRDRGTRNPPCSLDFQPSGQPTATPKGNHILTQPAATATRPRSVFEAGSATPKDEPGPYSGLVPSPMPMRKVILPWGASFRGGELRGVAVSRRFNQNRGLWDIYPRPYG